MQFPSGRPRTLRLAGLMALALSFAAGAPGFTVGPLDHPSLVTPAAAITYTRVSSIGPATIATSMAMPRLGISMPIKYGVLGAPISRKYAYHYPGTSWPGGGTNSYFYAHAQVGAFLNLKYARIGDLVTLRLRTGKYMKYKVTVKRSVAWNDNRWLLPTGTERITLQTCLGPYLKSLRLIVIAVPAY